MLNENDFNTLLESLLPPSKRAPLQRLLLLLLLVALAWLSLAGVLLGLYVLAAPLFHGPSMTYGEGLGFAGGILLYVGVSLLLKETK